MFECFVFGHLTFPDDITRFYTMDRMVRSALKEQYKIFPLFQTIKITIVNIGDFNNLAIKFFEEECKNNNGLVLNVVDINSLFLGLNLNKKNGKLDLDNIFGLATASLTFDEVVKDVFMTLIENCDLALYYYDYTRKDVVMKEIVDYLLQCDKKRQNIFINGEYRIMRRILKNAFMNFINSKP